MGTLMFYIDKQIPSHPGGPNPYENGWVYLAYDQLKLWRTKIGSTTKSVWDRIGTTTEDPEYVLFAAFHIPSKFHGEIKAIEVFLRRKMGCSVVDHQNGGRKSEHVLLSPPEALSIAVGKLPNCLDISTTEDGEYDFTTHLYLPEVYPYTSPLDGRLLEEYVELASPSMFLKYELPKAKNFLPFNEQKFLSEMESTDARTIYNVIGPEHLLQRLRYDRARWKLRQPKSQ